jgi:2,3-bisphosphoglycerate-independent phosphoglycerate mutase
LKLRMKKKRFILIFIDGIGIGEESDTNPFSKIKCQFLPMVSSRCRWPDGTPIKSVDPMVGLQGLPQSATCQTALFCGVSGKKLGETHRSGYPDQSLRKVILNENILIKMKRAHIESRFINAYPLHSHLFSSSNVSLEIDGQINFSDLFPEKLRRCISVTTCMLLSCHSIPLDIIDIVNQKALYQDFSNRSLILSGINLPEFRPLQAASILADCALDYDFILYEYFQTDIAAHRSTFNECVDLVRNLDELIGGLTCVLDYENDILMITSDHGNLEDLSHRRHTYNPVPLIIWGKKSNVLRSRIEGIDHITPTILAYMKECGIGKIT